MVQNIRLENKVLNNSLSLSTTETDYFILDSVDWGAIVASHQEYKYIGQYGVTIVGHTLGTRDIEIKGWIIANNESEMTQRKKQLNGFFNPLHLMTLYYSRYGLDFYCQKTIQYGTEHKENNEVICHWVVDGIAPDPFFRNVVDNIFDASQVRGMFHFPLTITSNNYDSMVFGNIVKTTTFFAYNTGHVPTGFRVTFYARGGSVTNPILTHVGKQEFIKINKRLEYGDRVIVDTNKGNRSVTGIVSGIRENWFKYRDLASSWITLDIGENIMNYNADNGIDLLDVTLDLTYRYEEVQECY